MLFSSAVFLYGFLPLVLVAYAAVPRRFRNAILLTASLLFYFCGEPRYTILLVVSSLSDYLHSLYIEARRGERAAKVALVSSIIVNLLMLGFFKYADFFIGVWNAVTGWRVPPLGIPLPIGISFFTFQTMSYTVDVYRGEVRAQRNFATFATFVCLFPQLVAGPIVRYSDIADELESRKTTLAGVGAGVRRFVTGLAKKVLIANTMGELCRTFRASDERTVLFFWLYAVGFTLQIYFDFSGYSDMAVGLGRLFGFDFPENFDYPYIARSVSEFWRRWHMTLGGWFRDYVYIPLGGNRVSKGRWLRNIALVWLLTGLWHGADWNFILWGGFYGALLMAEKLWLGAVLERAGGFFRHCYVLLAVALGFVLFNGDGLSGALSDLGGLFGVGAVGLTGPKAVYALRSYAVPLALAVLGSTPLLRRVYARVERRQVCSVLEPLALGGLLLTVTASLINGSFNPFLYLRF